MLYAQPTIKDIEIRIRANNFFINFFNYSQENKTVAFGKFPIGCIFSVMLITFTVFFMLAHMLFAKAKDSSKRGSFPLGNIPACLDTT
jgi:large-conductance mechanosensitive channel